MTSGGSNRTTVSAVRLTITPLRQRRRHDRRRVARQLEPPHQAGAADFLHERACDDASACSRCSKCGADALDVLADSRRRPDLVEDAERRAAGEQVAAVGAAVIAERDGVGDLLADQRRADRHAAAERLADGDQMRLEAERREVERMSGAAEAALDFVGDEERAGLRARFVDRRGERRRQRPDRRLRPAPAPR